MTKPATILFINLYTEMGGNEVAVLNLANSLDRSRFTPVMMFNRSGPFANRAEACGIETVIVGYQTVMLHRLAIPGVFWTNIKASRAIYQYLKRADIDIIQCSDVLSLLLICMPVLRLRIPVVYSVVFYYEWLRVLLFNMLALLIVDKIVANSDGVMEELRRRVLFLNNKMTVVHNGVDTSVFRPSEKGERDLLREELRETASTRIVGMVARFDPVKGHETFLASAEIILRRRPDVKFVVIGGVLMSDALPAWKVYYEKIMQLYEQSGLGHSVRFLDHREKIHDFMRNLDVLVCPSTREAFGLVVPEALASGVPVVVSGGVGALEAVKDQAGVYKAEAGDAESFARGVEHALDEKQRRAPLDLSKAFLENISLQKYGKQFERIYSEVRPQA